jgi:large subunit ribosomal protein L23
MAGALHTYDVLIRPLITEKATRLAEELNQYIFEVDVRANKHQIKEAVEVIFMVNVEDVHTLVVPPKRGRRGRKFFIRKKKWKKAIVSVKMGQKIALFNS